MDLLAALDATSLSRRLAHLGNVAIRFLTWKKNVCLVRPTTVGEAGFVLLEWRRRVHVLN